MDGRRVADSGWRRSGSTLVREVSFRDFDAAIALVEELGSAAEDHFRRPDMCIVDFNRVRLRIANPHHAGITEAEMRLKRKVDAVLDAS